VSGVEAEEKRRAWLEAGGLALFEAAVFGWLAWRGGGWAFAVPVGVVTIVWYLWLYRPALQARLRERARQRELRRMAEGPFESRNDWLD
jgi:hypothetical protein